MMRVVELAGLHAPLRNSQRPRPDPGPREVRVRVAAVGVCGSDLFLQNGGFGAGVSLPVVPGHEASGFVDAVGTEVTELHEGDQVALYYITTPIGDPWAAEGRPNISPALRRMGVDCDGAMAEYVVRPAESLIRPPSPIAAEVLAILTDAVATPLHAVERVARVRPGESVAVLGLGGIGSTAIQVAALSGARVIAVTRTARKRELALRLGAADVVVGESPAASIRRLTGGLGPDVVLQCTGVPEMNQLAVEVAGPGARVVLVGTSNTPFALRDTQLIWKELSILGSRGFVPDDIRRGIALYMAGLLRTDHLVEHVRPLHEAEMALDDLRDGRVLRTVLLPADGSRDTPISRFSDEREWRMDKSRPDACQRQYLV